MKLTINNLYLKRRGRLIFEIDNYSVNFFKMQLIGKNGVGKSTLLNNINNNVCTQIDAQRIIYLNQKLNLLKKNTVEDNIYILSGEDKREVLNNFCELFPATQVDTVVNLLSGGQQQVLNLLIGLSHQADLYLIDEPFNNLDQRIKNDIYNYLEQLNSHLIVISHGELLEFCDTKITLNNGVLYEG